MKILVVSTVGVTANGIIVVLKNYYSRINKEKFKVDFVFPRARDEKLKKEFESMANVEVFPRGLKNIPSYMFKLYKLIKENKYDIVHVHGNSATMVFEMLAAAVGGVKVRIVHSHNTECSSKRLHSLLNPLFKRLYTHTFACGEKAGAWLFGDGKARIIKNGVDLDKFKFDDDARQKIRDELNVSDKIVIGHIGVFNEQKNHVFLIDIFEALYKKNQNCHLVLVGSGEKFEEIKELVGRKGLTDAVTFAGIVRNSNEFYQAFDAFVLPSLFEGLPLVSVEAQASGLPCIIADTVSEEAKVTELVEFLSLETSPDKWADAILSKVSEKDRKEVSQRAVVDLTEAGFDIVKNVEDLEKIYEEMLKI